MANPHAELDRQFLSQLDPYIHFKAATALHQAKGRGLSLRIEDDGVELDEHEILGSIEENLYTSLDISMHFQRFLQVETFIRVLLSRPPVGPIQRFYSSYTAGTVSTFCRDIANRKIPSCWKKFLASGESFDDWLWKLYGLQGFDISTSQKQELIEYTIEEATFFQDRSAYNAFKHGCHAFFGQAAIKRKDRETKEYSEVLRIERGVAWSDWQENDAEILVTHRAYEFDPEYDLTRMFVGAAILSVLKNVCLARHRGEEKINITLPDSFRGKSKSVQRVVLNIRYLK